MPLHKTLPRKRLSVVARGDVILRFFDDGGGKKSMQGAKFFLFPCGYLLWIDSCGLGWLALGMKQGGCNKMLLSIRTSIYI